MSGGTPSNAWLTLGNAGTNPATNFVGTSDNVDLVFRTNNTEKMRITANGNVGIGTTSPSDRLHVAGGDARIGEINPTNTGSFPGYGRYLYFSGGPAGNNWNSDNSDPLWIARYNVAPDQTELRVNIGDNCAANDAFVVGTYGGACSPAGPKWDILRVQANGNVGIGTAAPGAKLDVAGRVALSGLESPGYGGASAGVAIIGTPNSGGGLLFRPAGLDNNIGEVLFRSDASYFSGNVGIGTTTPEMSLHIVGNGGLLIQRAGTSGFANVYFRTGTDNNVMASIGFTGYGGTNDLIFRTGGLYERMIITSTGNVGIGTTAPSQKLEVCGNAKVVGQIIANSSNLSAGVFCSSDIHYKKDITPLTNALNNVMQLRGVNYFWKTKEFPEKQFPDTKQIGFIAQELEKVYPEVVFTDKDGYKSVDYSKLTPILVEAIKDQQKIIQQLQEENFKTKQANLQLKEENNQIKAEMKLLNEKVDNLINSLSNHKTLVTTE